GLFPLRKHRWISMKCVKFPSQQTTAREAIALFFPVAIVIECDLTFLFPIVDLDGGDGAEPLENLTEGALEFGRQCLGQGEFQDILDAGQVREVIGEAIVVLYSSVDTVVQEDELTRLKMDPCLF